MEEINSEDIKVLVAEAEHEKYVDTIIDTIREAARKRGTGIAERTHEYVATKMREGKGVLALHGDRFVGFSYIETWGNKHYVTTSGLIVHPDYQGLGVAKRIKDYTFTLARLRWPSLPTTTPSGMVVRGASTTTSSKRRTASSASAQACFGTPRSIRANRHRSRSSRT